MTVQHIALVLDQPAEAFENIGQRLTMVALANHTDEEGWCWPSIRRIAHEVGLSEGATRRHIDRLEDAGWLTKAGRKRREDGTLSVTVYRVDVDRLHRAALRGGPPRSSARSHRADLRALNPQKNPHGVSNSSARSDALGAERVEDTSDHLPGTGFLGERPPSPDRLAAEAQLDAEREAQSSPRRTRRRLSVVEGDRT